MRNALRITVIVAVLAAIPAVASAATAGGGKPLAINCNQEQFKPKRIVLSCGDGGSWLAKLKWSSWTGSNATGSGNYAAINCTPSCAGGHTTSSPVKVTLSKPKTCPGQTGLAFKQATFTYTGTRPKGAPAKFSFHCPPTLPGAY